MEKGIVNRITDSPFHYQGWPSVCRDENGVLYAVASAHRLGHVCPFGKNLMYVSYDEGKTWSCPIIINDTPYDDRDAGILSLGNGKLIMSYFNNPHQFMLDNRAWVENDCRLPLVHDMAMAYLDALAEVEDPRAAGGSYIRISENSGMSWGEAIKVPVSSPHGPRKLSDGRLIYFGRESYTNDPELIEGDIYVYDSADGGKTWNKLAHIDYPDYLDRKTSLFCEPDCIEMPDGTIVAAIRVHMPTKPTLTVSTCISKDGGKTWTEPKPVGCDGSPPHLLLHSSGLLIMTYSRRETPYGIRAMISRDGGLTFGEEITLVDDQIDGDLGYPCSVELSDGSIFTLYYAKYPGDKHNSILYTKWNLD